MSKTINNKEEENILIEQSLNDNNDNENDNTNFEKHNSAPSIGKQTNE
jgi:hypothetical protein